MNSYKKNLERWDVSLERDHSILVVIQITIWIYYL